MRLASGFRLSDSIVVVLHAGDGTVADVNPAFERVLGWRREEALGRLSIELGIWPDHEIRAVIWGRLRSERRLVGLPAHVRRRDGELLAGVLTCEPFEEDGRAYFLGIIQDYRPADAPLPERHDRESYRALFLAAAEGIYRSLPGGGFIDVNPAMARIFGYPDVGAMLSDLRRDAARLYLDPDHAARLHADLERVDRVEDRRAQVRRVDGSVIWISENSRAVRDTDGRLLFYEGSITDITSRLAAEAALRESEALYKVLIDNCRDGVFLVQSGRIVFANRALSAMLGYGPDELSGTDYFALVAPEDRAAQAERRAAREGGSRAAQQYEVTLLRRDGQRAVFAVHADAIEYRGRLASTGVMRDVTEERRRQRALEEAERKYRELFEQSPVGLFRTHPDGRILEVNGTLARIMGYDDVDQLKGSLGSIMDVYADPTLRPRMLERLARDGAVRDVRLEVLCRDGHRKWVEVSVRVAHGPEGEAHFQGSVQDVTERLATAEALQRSEAKYRTLVEHSQVGVFILRGDCLVYANRALVEMSGYGEAEITGRSFLDLIAPEYRDAARERMARRERGDPISSEYETCAVRRDGTRVYVTISIGPVMLDGVRHTTGTVRDVTAHRQAEQRLRFHAAHDPLTGLPNRTVVQERLAEALRAARTGSAPDYAVLFLDLDGFKLVNDSLGHAAGDRLLVVIAEKLSVAMAGEGLVARYGGDEFVILPTVPCSRERAGQLAERVLALFEGSFDIGGQRVYSGTSLGIVLGRPEYRSPDQVMRDADTAMYRAKAQGKSGFVVFDEAMHAATRERFQLEIDLRLALERGEFRVHYQPIVALATASIVGVEALVRWQHPQRGLLPPASFLHVAEEAGLIAEIDWWVMEEACTRVAGWRRRHPRQSGLHLNVNVDERQLASRTLVDELRGILARSGLEPAALGLEVTETVFRAGRGHAADTLAALKNLGVTLIVDDFGTGYSSLDSFAASPFDALKVDRSFVQDMEVNRRHRAIVRTITGFAEDLGLALTAEGVETIGQARLLAELGCDTAQGFLYSPPVPPEALEQMLDAPDGLIAKAG